MKLKLFVFLSVMLFISGCNYEFTETPQKVENTNSVEKEKEDILKPAEDTKTTADNSISENKNGVEENAANTDEGGTLFLDGSSEVFAFPCNGREVEVGGTANIVNLSGECKKLIVAGVSNKVNVEKVGEINVDGVSNKVTYVEGMDGKKPKISKKGTSTSVDKKEDIK